MTDPREVDLFDKVRVPASVDEALRAANPWWAGRPGRPVPTFRRSLFPTLLHKLKEGPAPVVVVRGARQVGKTTLQEQVIEHLLESEAVEARRVLRVQFDELEGLREVADPILAVVRWYESRVLGQTLNEAAREGRPAFLLFDEVQNLPSWAPQLKHLVDHHAGRVAVTGSSALRIQAGQDSLAGRLDLLEIGTLSLREIAGLSLGGAPEAWLAPNGLAPLREPEFWRGLADHAERHRAVRDEAFRRFAERGGYPLAQSRWELQWTEVADQLAEQVVRRVIRHDLRMGEVGRKRDESLLVEVFRLACRYAGQAPTRRALHQEIQQTLAGNVGEQRITSYLGFLDGALLIRLVQPMEIRLKKSKSPPKICLVDHAIRAAWLQEDVALDPANLGARPELADLAGHLAESVVGSFLMGITHLDLGWFPARPGEPEIDFVVTIGEQRIPIEVKYGRRVDPARDLQGLTHFLDKRAYGAPFGVLVTRDEDVAVDDPRIVPLSLRSLLMLR